MTRFLTILAVVIQFLTLVGVAEATVVNGGFEFGNFTGWTVIPASDGSNIQVMPYSHLPGSYSARFHAFRDEDDTILQSIPTVTGQGYTFEFWLQNNDTNGFNNTFSAYWNGANLLNLVDADGFVWTHFTYNVVAKGSSTTIAFAGSNQIWYFYLDDVSVNPVPLPGAIWLLGSGLLGLAGWRRLRKG